MAGGASSRWPGTTPAPNARDDTSAKACISSQKQPLIGPAPAKRRTPIGECACRLHHEKTLEGEMCGVRERFDPHNLGDVVTAMYASISGPAGPRDWAAQERLFFPDARMMRTEIDTNGRARLRIMTRKQYAENTTPYFAAHAFYEIETKRRVDLCGDIAHVWSTYEARHNPSDDEPERRGINSIQLRRDATGAWRIVSMLWDNERQEALTNR